MKLLPTQRLLPVTASVMVIAIGAKAAALAWEMPPLSDIPVQAASAMLAAGGAMLPPAEAAKMPTRPRNGLVSAAAVTRPATPAGQPDTNPPATDANPAAARPADASSGDAKRPDAAASTAPPPAAASAAGPVPASAAPPAATPIGAPVAAPVAVPSAGQGAGSAFAAPPPGAAPKPAGTVAGAVPATAPRVPLADADKALLEDMRTRRSQSESREQVLDQREAALGAAEKRLTERVAELAALQARLQEIQKGLKERDEANWEGMVKTYETMRPRDAAQIFNALDKNVLIEVVDRMKPAKVAPILAAMDTDRARMLTADVAARRTQSTDRDN